MVDFLTRSKELERTVGDGVLAGIFAVDGGARTVPLEVGFWRSGPNAGVHMRNFTTPGTGPHAAQNALEVMYEVALQDIAKTALSAGPQGAMRRHVERVDGEFKRRAPRVTGDYADSTARFVTDVGNLVYERYGAHYGEEPGGS